MICVMILHMNDILMLMIVMDIIPNYIYFNFISLQRCLYPSVSAVFADVM